MSSRVKIIYREFYDIPRVFIVNYNEKLFLFESEFLDKADDYSNQYKIYLLPKLTQDELNGSWVDMNRKAICNLDSVHVNSVEFDSTLRKDIDTKIIDNIGKKRGLWV